MSVPNAVEKITGFRLLKDDWDTYGSPPVPERVIQQALRLVALAEDEGLWPPAPVPISGGGVQLEWYRGTGFSKYSLEIVVYPGGGVEYVLLDHADDAIVEDESSQLDEYRARGVMRRFRQAPS